MILTVERDRLVRALRRRREALGLSTHVLSGQIGTPAQLIGEWERGEVTPNLGSFLRWARALDMSVEVSPALEGR